MATRGEPDAVLLVHGTFASVPADEEPTRRPWWSPHGDFARLLDQDLRGCAACWPSRACARLPWNRPGRRGDRPGRPTFVWSGLNHEGERREAGRRLLEGLLALEAGPAIPYHLVGHSYGGAVIWYALVEAERRHRTLHNLRSWTTLGTPFPSYRARPWSFLDGIVLACGLIAAGVLAWLLGWWLPPALLGEYLASLSMGCEVAITFLALFVGMVAIDRLAAAAWRVWERRERALAEAAWAKYGSGWLGLCSRSDEALAAVRNAVGLHVRIPWVRGGRLSWVPNLVIVLLVMPLSYVARAKSQGGPRFGAVLGSVSTGPAPPWSPEATLAPALDRTLKDRADRHTRANLAADLERARESFTKLGEEERAGWSAVEWLRENISLRFGLYHNYYYRIEAIRHAVAAHILRHADAGPAGAPPAGAGIGPGVAAEPGETRACRFRPVWPPRCSGPRVAAKPIDTVPWWARLPYAVAVVVLLVLTAIGMRNSFHDPFLRHVLDPLEQDSPLARARRVEAVGAMGLVGQSAMLDRLLGYAAMPGYPVLGSDQEDVETMLFDHLKGGDRATARLIEDRFSSAGSGQRLRLLKLLWKMGPVAESVPLFVRVLEPGDRPLFERGDLATARDYALQAIRDIGPCASGAIPCLERIARGQAGPTDPETRRLTMEMEAEQAIEALGAIGCAARGSLEALAETVGDDELRSRARAIVVGLRSRCGPSQTAATGRVPGVRPGA